MYLLFVYAFVAVTYTREYASPSVPTANLIFFM